MKSTGLLAVAMLTAMALVGCGSNEVPDSGERHFSSSNQYETNSGIGNNNYIPVDKQSSSMDNVLTGISAGEGGTKKLNTPDGEEDVFIGTNTQLNPINMGKWFQAEDKNGKFIMKITSFDYQNVKSEISRANQQQTSGTAYETVADSDFDSKKEVKISYQMCYRGEGSKIMKQTPVTIYISDKTSTTVANMYAGRDYPKIAKGSKVSTNALILGGKVGIANMYSYGAPKDVYAAIPVNMEDADSQFVFVKLK